jgi:hypothetical protein
VIIFHGPTLLPVPVLDRRTIYPDVFNLVNPLLKLPGYHLGMYSIQSIYGAEDGLLVNAAQRKFGLSIFCYIFVSLELQDDGPELFHPVSQFQDATTSSGPKCETSAAWSFKFRFVVRVGFILSKLTSAAGWIGNFQAVLHGSPVLRLIPIQQCFLQKSRCRPMATLIEVQKCQRWNKHETYGLGKLEDIG